MRDSQRAFCAGVPPTRIGSVPRQMARKAVATPRSCPAISSETRQMSRAPPPRPPAASGRKIRCRPTSGDRSFWMTSVGKTSCSSSSRSLASGSSRATTCRRVWITMSRHLGGQAGRSIHADSSFPAGAGRLAARAQGKCDRRRGRPGRSGRRRRCRSPGRRGRRPRRTRRLGRPISRPCSLTNAQSGRPA